MVRGQVIEKEQPKSLEESQEGVASQKLIEEGLFRHHVSFRTVIFPNSSQKNISGITVRGGG